MAADAKQPREQNKTRDNRDKPFEQEADKDIKEGGIAGARRRRGKPDAQ